jgi:hypothetical protein
MPEVSLTAFVDFVSRAGSPKLTVVSRWKHMPEYRLSRDLYRSVRLRIVEMHSADEAISALTGLLAELRNARQISTYPAIIEGYRVWRGRKRIRWFDPATTVWSHGDLDVRVNPELGLEINGVPHLIKLYFKADKLSKQGVSVIPHLMRVACGEASPDGCVMGVLDVRRSRLHTLSVRDPALDVLLRGEAAYWMTVWPSV